MPFQKSSTLYIMVIATKVRVVKMLHIHTYKYTKAEKKIARSQPYLISTTAVMFEIQKR